MLRNLVLRFFINAVALWLVDVMFTDISFMDTPALFITAIVFGLLNAVIKPLLLFFTLPINLLTLGLFTLIINAIVLELADWLIDSFVVDGFGTAILAALFISIISTILSSLLREER